MVKKLLTSSFGFLGILLFLSLALVQGSEEWQHQLSMQTIVDSPETEEGEQETQLWLGSIDFHTQSVQIFLPLTLILLVIYQLVWEVNYRSYQDLFIPSTGMHFRTLFRRIRSINAP